METKVILDVDGGIASGMVDCAGRPAKRCESGYWQSACYIIGVGVAERFAYYGISSNLITYLTGPLGMPTAAAASTINIWTGAGSLIPLFGAFVADSFLGPYRTIVLSSLLYILALGLLTASATLQLNSQGQGGLVFFFVSLYLMALGQGVHKPCILAFGADQFDEQDPNELRSKSSFFNWWYFGMCAAPLAALIILNYIQDNISWGLGFGIPCISMSFALLLFLLGTKSYRYSCIKADHEKCTLLVRLLLSKVIFIKAAINSPSTSVYNEEALLAPDHEEVEEEAKSLVNLIPLWFTSLAFAICLAQPPTLFTQQGITMDRSISIAGTSSTFDVPAASLQYIIGITIILFIPIYDRILVPLTSTLTGTHSGITKLERIGIGMFLCTLSMVTAALVERKRLKMAYVYGLCDFPKAKVPMSFWWLIPQYILYGVADVFTLIGLQQLFYDEMPCGLKSVGLSIYISICGTGNFLSSFLISIIQRITSSHEDGESGWFSDNTNGGHLDYFYWLLGGLNALGFIAFLYFAKSFKCNSNSK